MKQTSTPFISVARMAIGLGAALLYATTAMAQLTVGTYPCARLDKDYTVKAAGDGSFWIATSTREKRETDCGIILKKTVVDQFREALTAAKAKYVEWSAIAADSSVQDVTKEMPVKFPRVGCYFYYGDIQFAFGQRIAAAFSLDNGKPGMLIWSGRLTSATNQFMHNDGIFMVFSNTEEIDALYALLDATKAEQILKAKQSQEDLFK